VYNIGKYKVAEFPLFINKRRVFVTEQLADADARRVVAGTLYKALFVQSPNGKMEARIVQYTPTYAYLAGKHFDISHLSFQTYASEFKGDVMLYDYDNNMKTGWHLSTGKPKRVTLHTKLVTDEERANSATNSSGNLCDNAIDIQPNCYYTIHTVFDYQCSGGWNPYEGFNPDYCQITQIVSVECELEYCEEEGVDLIQECMNQGYTQAECMCQVYGLGCENIGGYDEQACQQAQQQFNEATEMTINMENTSMPHSPSTKDTTIRWIVTEHSLNTWRVAANTHIVYKGYYVNNVYHTNVSTLNTTSFFEGSNALVNTTWTQTSVSDAILSNNAPVAETKSTVNGTLVHKYKNLPHPICQLFDQTVAVTNSRELEF
jgi:hypothetical protein